MIQQFHEGQDVDVEVCANPVDLVDTTTFRHARHGGHHEAPAIGLI